MTTATRSMLGGFAVLATVGLGMLVLSEEEISARGAFNEASLRGSYKYNLVDVRTGRSGLDFCEETGTATLDGSGNATVVATRRCSNPAAITDVTNTMTYKVSSDGQVTFRDVGAARGTTTHGWIVDGGNMVLIDGTTKTPPGAGTLVTHGVAAKQ
jgi:hypothetical protein